MGNRERTLQFKVISKVWSGQVTVFFWYGLSAFGRCMTRLGTYFCVPISFVSFLYQEERRCTTKRQVCFVSLPWSSPMLFVSYSHFFSSLSYSPQLSWAFYLPLCVCVRVCVLVSSRVKVNHSLCCLLSYPIFHYPHARTLAIITMQCRLQSDYTASKFRSVFRIRLSFSIHNESLWVE